MRNQQEKLDQTIGMEDLFALGGFVEETARKTIMEAWDNALSEIGMRMGAGGRRVSLLGELSQIIFETIATYEDGPDAEDLYLTLMNKAEDYFANYKENEIVPDDIDEEAHQKMISTED